MELTFTYLALLFYLSASLAYMGSLATRPGKLLRAAGILARVGFILHTGALAIHLYQQGRPPGALGDWLSFYAWATAVVYIITEVHYESKVIGSFAVFAISLSERHRPHFLDSILGRRHRRFKPWRILYASRNQ